MKYLALAKIKRHVDLAAFPLQVLATAVVLAVIGYGSGQIIPIYMKKFEFEQAAKKEVQLAALNWTSEDDIHEAVYRKGQELGIPVEREAITVDAVVRQAGPKSLSEMMGASTSQPTERASINVEVSYAVPVDFPGYTFVMKLRFHVDDHMA